MLMSQLKFDIVNKYYFDVVLNSTNKEAVFVKLVNLPAHFSFLASLEVQGIECAVV